MDQPRDIWVIALDETRHWNLKGLAAYAGLAGPEALQPYLQRIEGLYFFDHNEQTYCCEMTPSYCLYPYGQRAVPTPAAQAEAAAHDPDLTRWRSVTDAPLIDRLNEWIDPRPDYEPIYCHCGEIDALLHRYQAEGGDDRCRQIGDPGLEPEAGEHDWIDRLTEAFQADAPL